MSFIRKIFEKEQDYCKKLVKMERFMMKNDGFENQIKFYNDEAPEILDKYKKMLSKHPKLIEQPELAKDILKGIAQDFYIKAFKKCGMTYKDIESAAAYEEKLESDTYASTIGQKVGGKAKKSVKQTLKKIVKRSKPKPKQK